MRRAGIVTPAGYCQSIRLKSAVMARIFRLRDLAADVFASICSTSQTLAEIIRRIGLTSTSTAYRDVKRRARREGVSLKHIPQGLGSNAGRPNPNRTPIEKILMSSNRGWIKRAIIRDNLLPYSCAVCKNPPVWNGKPLVLRLDHINGDPLDNSLSNLRFVCPNCDSQLPTFSGRNRKNVTRCVDCGRKITPGCVRCAPCYDRVGRPKKITWPEGDALLFEIKSNGYRATALKLGVSDAAIKKHLRHHHVEVPRFHKPRRS
jgi:hypothetical protein